MTLEKFINSGQDGSCINQQNQQSQQSQQGQEDQEDQEDHQGEKGCFLSAMSLVASGTSIRKAAERCDVPFESLRRRVNGHVPVECRSG